MQNWAYSNARGGEFASCVVPEIPLSHASEHQGRKRAVYDGIKPIRWVSDDTLVVARTGREYQFIVEGFYTWLDYTYEALLSFSGGTTGVIQKVEMVQREFVREQASEDDIESFECSSQ